MAFAYAGAVERFLACALGSVGCLLLMDPLHGKASPEFKANFGYDGWFVPLVGLWEIAISYLLVRGDARAAAKMLAVIMGGGIYSHAVREGKPEKAVAPLIFLALSTYVAAAQQPLLEAAVQQLCLACCGAVIGIAVFYASAKGKST
ncbi:hypothetical protein M885DRAFT_503805 [Pelagophyceae sp. CCMP2097]|nr:hypothetical protein M885DRAFT_503805 [Pelagophyceae sp. CCMP2097]